MKKHRKLVALLIALTFLFSVAAPAMAAAPSDAELAADKLNVLGIIEGYPDGSFGLDQNITRAEFAKIAVAAAGLTEAAEQLVNFPSQFSDVKVGEWYTGWINMAASQGFVKGDPAGTYRPNDNITYAEVVTVLVRLLGYDDNLTGPWPTNYLAKAVELDITEGVALNASAPAVRGDVFVMANNTLDCNTVYWNADNLDWTVKDDKLIVKSFKGVMDNGIVTDISWDSKGDLYLDLVDNDGKDLGNLKLVDNVIVTGAEDAYGLLGKQVEFIKNEKASGADKNAIVYLGAKDTDSVYDDEAEYTGRYIEVDDKKYDVASGFGVTYFPGDGDFDDRDDVTLEGDKVEVVLNEDGEAQWAFVYDFADPDVIEEVDGDEAFGYLNARIEYDEDDLQVFIKDGAIASFDDLAEGDLVYVYEDARNTDLLVFAVSEVVEGELEKANAAWTQLTVDGSKIDTDDDYIVSEDGGDNFDDNSIMNDDMIGESVSYMLSPAGRIAVVISGVESVSGKYGVLEYYGDTARGVEARILNGDGTKAVYYVDSDYSTDFVTAIQAARIATGESYVLVEYDLNSDGKIDSVEVADASSSFENDADNRAELDGKWYRFNDAVFFGYETDKNDSSVRGKLIATDWDDFRGLVDNSAVDVYVLMDGGAIKAMLSYDIVTDPSNVGVIAGTGRNSKGFYYEVFTGGEKVTYNTTGNADEDLGKGTIVSFVLASGRISTINELTPSEVSSYSEVAETSSSSIKVNDTYYYIDDEDTMIVDITDSTKKLVNRVGRGDYVVVHGYDDGVVELIVIDNNEEPGTGDGGTGDGVVEAVVTYIKAKETIEVEIDGKVETFELTGTARNLTDGLAVGDEVKLEIEDGRLVDLEIVKSKAEKDAEELAAAKTAAEDALADLSYTAANSIDDADKLAEAKEQVATAKAAVDAYLEFAGTATGDLTGYANLADQETEIERYEKAVAKTAAEDALADLSYTAANSIDDADKLAEAKEQVATAKAAVDAYLEFTGTATGDLTGYANLADQETEIERYEKAVAKTAAEDALAGLNFTKVGDIDSDYKLGLAKAEYEAAEAAVDAYLEFTGTATGDLTGYANLAAQKAEIDRYEATK